MAHVSDPLYCNQCGKALRRCLPGEGAPFICTTCSQPIYLDPKVAVAAVVHRGGEVVLLRRAQRDDAHGRWILPGGHVDRGEEVAAACLREVAEETGLQVELDGLLGVYSYPGNPVVLIVFRARAALAPLVPSDEALEIQAFPPDRIPWDQLGYLSTSHALRDALTGDEG